MSPYSLIKNCIGPISDESKKQSKAKKQILVHKTKMAKSNTAKLLITITLSLCSAMMVMMIIGANAAAAVEDETDTTNDNSEFFHTCSGGDYDKFKSFLDADPTLVHATTKDGEHCLHLCAISGNADIVKTLLERGADPNIRSTFKDGLRMHPLSWHTFYGRYDIIELLLEHGADIEADFDLGGSVKDEQTGELTKVTVLDVVEKILISEVDDEQRMRFAMTRNVLMKYGALRYAHIEPEL